MDLRTFKASLEAIRSRIDPSKPDDASRVLQEALAYMLQVEPTLDPAARRELDAILDRLIAHGVEEGRRRIPAMPEGPQRREAVRLVARGAGQHYAAGDLALVLERPTQLAHPALLTAREAFLVVLQASLDFLFDVRQGAVKGKQMFALYGLSLWAVDELLVAFHLAQHAFTNQAYSQLRTVDEILDKLELFSRDRTLAEFWVDEEDEEIVWRRLKPGKVRRALGREPSDALYHFLSVMGPHSSFRGLQARGGFASGEQGRYAAFFVAGAPLDNNIVTSNVLAVRAAVALAHSVARVFAGSLDQHEVTRRLDKCSSALGSLVAERLGTLAEHMRLSPDETRRILAPT